jgi:hypothetical protein
LPLPPPPLLLPQLPQLPQQQQQQQRQQLTRRRPAGA